tara:strand:+ start:193 stop:504 length:312 start_codon:yes stop_codon:yes gene_type:complete
MAQFVKKENLTISIGTYKDQQGNEKKQWKTIGEIITMNGDDGHPYQFFKLWGAGGIVEGKVFEQQENNNQAPQQAPQGGYQQVPQQQAPQQGYQPPAQTQYQR